jgi:glycosyltransferase involved in cell wall biosynthesis
VAGDGAILLDVSEPSAWIDALRLAVEQPEKMRPQRERALARAGEFSWTRTAKLTRAVYDHAVKRFRK